MPRKGRREQTGTSTTKEALESSEGYDCFSIGGAQLLQRGAILKNTDFIFGVAVYTGQHTKLMMNANRTRSKRSHAWKMTNGTMVVQLGGEREGEKGAGLLLLIATIAVAFEFAFRQRRLLGCWYLDFHEKLNLLGSPKRETCVDIVPAYVGFMMLYQGLIPISLYVSLETIQLFQAWFIHNVRLLSL